MNGKLRKIMNYYGMAEQLKYFQGKVFDLNEAIIIKRNTGVLESLALEITNALLPKKFDYTRENIKKEIADVMIMIKQFQLYYDISTDELKEVITSRIDKKLEKIRDLNTKEVSK